MPSSKPVFGQKTSSYPYGYGYCQDGCGKVTQLKDITPENPNGIWESYIAAHKPSQEKLESQNSLDRPKEMKLQGMLDSTDQSVPLVMADSESVSLQKRKSSVGTIQCKHVTIRMAWHDSNWNGTICADPEGNSYCVGTHSLLSGRIEKKRNLAFEKANTSGDVSTLSTHEIPPCYWSLNAFGNKDIPVAHSHAFSWLNLTPIPETLRAHSVYTWPFKLSFVHTEKNKKKHGNYPPDLESRIADFLKKFTPGESIIFFYANYDNPVSADEMRYLLLGCSIISEIPEPKSFKIDAANLRGIRQRSAAMKNFPTINWALQFTHDPARAVVLPYKEYIEYSEQNPEDEEKLKEMRVLVEEESLVAGFKYVAMDLEDDKCLYLLYKLRKAIKAIQEHKQIAVKSDLVEEERRIEDLITKAWAKRGIYPSLAAIIDLYNEDRETSAALAKSLADLANPNRDVLQIVKGIAKTQEVAAELKDHKDVLLDLLGNRKFSKNLDSLIRLSLFNLTAHQVRKILDNQDLLDSLKDNPYVLFEDYKADENDLDEPDLKDEAIDLYKIDIGMIPDRRFVKRHRDLQNLSEDSPQRVRAVIIDYLREIGGVQGHCYDHSANVLRRLNEHPLFYRNNVAIDADAVSGNDADYISFFVEKLHIEKNEGSVFFYLKEIWNAERQVRQIVDGLVHQRKDHSTSGLNFEAYIDDSARTLSKRLPDFNEQQFQAERRALYENLFARSLYLITGRPGSGKTYEVSKIIETLRSRNEEVVVLAPTGKAALRLSQNIAANTSIDLKAETIDRFIFAHDYGWAFEDWDRLDRLASKDKIAVQNLILDESSMIDLQKLKILLSIVRLDAYSLKRLVLVGDENQLPPIGFGKPFHDIVMHLLSDEKLQTEHYINLRSNCRQENDPKIIQLAEAFTDKTRYYEEALQMLEKEGDISPGLSIIRWNNKDDLQEKLIFGIEGLLPLGLSREDVPLDRAQRLNQLLGLYNNGYVNNQEYRFKDYLKLDVFQCLTPYRGGHAGTVGINNVIQLRFRKNDKSSELSSFYHSDKIIRLYNWYWGRGKERRLVLSNGSIGVCTGEGYERRYYFPDAAKPFWSMDSEENLDLAYAITVHKAQGSDFETVFLVIPNKLTLLCKELVYTALTRSRCRLVIFLQKVEENLLAAARQRSHLLNRNTSIFTPPQDNKALYQPAKDVFVKSKVEFIIYKALEKSGLQFSYESTLPLSKRSYDIHPDFTITVGDKNVYWEHLGMLDVRKYYQDWQRRKNDYSDHGLIDHVVTTDDLDGIADDKILTVIDDIKSGKIAATPENRFSAHHYNLR